MYKGFNLDIKGINYSEYIEYGKTIHAHNKIMVENELASFKDSEGNLIASKIIAGWFPSIKADVFLSHSHKDADQIIGLSGWLNKKFGLIPFADSCIWGFSDDLLRMMDDEYCYSQARDTYSYQKRNRSTSHVYMMMSTALAKMINNCECLIFVNTTCSISPKKYIKDGDTTDSPWIYSELALTSLVQRRSSEEHRVETIKSRVTLDSISKSIPIKYDVDLTHLTELTVTHLNKWDKINNEFGPRALDSLYELTSKVIFE